ncbi:hypothetical protein PYW07_012399 [Mythimna separata]|uniref:C-type lectin domain-containing protein n=1 Tax=Mythimna separata TaxID=271217 RepID=A0AAD7YLM2_MYTSE|nr:hypothetical protein PYW07_012399 [Mythimna separata]
MKCTVFTAFLLGVVLPTIYSRHVQFYRKDYTYIEDFDAFYKVHWDVSGSTWSSAFLTCDDEGSTLFYPKAQGEWMLVKNLTNKMTEVPNVTDIFVGLHDEFDLGEFMTVDGHSTPYPLPAEGNLLPHHDNCITMNTDTGLFNVDSCSRAPDAPLPFVCKKVDDESCPTVDRGYKFMKASKKCYKVNRKPQVWQEAMKTCFMEGGVLAVIENKAQAEEIRNMLENGEMYFVGVRKMFSSAEYYTVKGQKFSEMYRNTYNGDNYDCGSVWSRDSVLYTETKSCDSRLPFICEMEVTS